jgi:hypothetical protein
MKMELINCTPPGSIYPSGWIQSDIFIDWFRHFIRHVKPTAGDPVILVLHGHFSRVYNLEVVDLGRENHVYITSLSPHSTHKMQPLDMAFMGPLKCYYGRHRTLVSCISRPGRDYIPGRRIIWKHIHERTHC